MKALVEISQRNGESLRARDLMAEVNGDAARRALHVRAVHGTWGVALGFELALADGGQTITVGPGFGYDCRGREIASAELVVTRLPTRDEPADLVISGECGVHLGWREPGRGCDDELVLARARFKDGSVVALDESVRHWCRARRFRMAAGVVEKQVAAKVTISTAAGGFHATPRYFATLDSDIKVAATTEIDDETASSFRLSFHAPGEQIKQADQNKRKVRVHWVGVEALPQCALDPEENK